ncbi:MAG: glycosyl transferase [Legionellales bacterium RIFCSPHIGHO2_12_FULL_35_11]|nr:MAG: glycosyl transferase [Legionellales bacterium RIFCSPHIGHO2_12_FULL_35_11]
MELGVKEKQDLKISVILSFYNEENVLPELLLRMRKVFSGLIAEKTIGSYELVFVNDNSTDGSKKLLLSEIPVGDVVLINMTRNFGVSECVMAGIRESTGDAVIYMDSDLQDPPELIPELISAWQADSEVGVVYTTRRRRAGENYFKMLITKFGYRLINLISDIDLPADSGDFKLLSREVVERILELKEDKPYMRGLVSWVGYKQLQVFYDREARFDGRENSKMPVLSRKVLYYWLDRALISFSDAPLKAILLLGFAISSISIAYLGVILFQKIMGWYVPGWPALMSAILLSGGVQMMMLGFVGLYVGAIFRETKGRPQYLIKDVVKPRKSS